MYLVDYFDGQQNENVEHEGNALLNYIGEFVCRDDKTGEYYPLRSCIPVALDLKDVVRRQADGCRKSDFVEFLTKRVKYRISNDHQW